MSVCFTYRSRLFGDVPLVLMRRHYSENNNTAIIAISPTDDDGFEVFADVTKNLGESLVSHEFFLNSDVADMIDDLEEANIAQSTGEFGYSGFNEYRLMRISDAAFESMDVFDYGAEDPFEHAVESLSRYMEDPSAFRIDKFTTSMPMPSPPRGPITGGPSGGEDYEWDIPF